jgi:hypothetical protein
MTAAEWRTTHDPVQMLRWLRGPRQQRQLKTSVWRLRLLTLACCERISPLLVDERSRAALEALRLGVDASNGESQLAAVRSGAGCSSSTAGLRDGLG